MKKELHPELGYVLASKHRQKVLVALMENALCPSEISKKTDLHQSHVSKTLKELTARSLLVCMNPNDRKGRLYNLTADGKTVCAQLACHGKKQ